MLAVASIVERMPVASAVADSDQAVEYDQVPFVVRGGLFPVVAWPLARRLLGCRIVAAKGSRHVVAQSLGSWLGAYKADHQLDHHYTCPPYLARP